jgi:hypothetical protein
VNIAPLRRVMCADCGERPASRESVTELPSVVIERNGETWKRGPVVCYEWVCDECFDEAAQVAP